MYNEKFTPQLCLSSQNSLWQQMEKEYQYVWLRGQSSLRASLYNFSLYFAACHQVQSCLAKVTRQVTKSFPCYFRAWLNYSELRQQARSETGSCVFPTGQQRYIPWQSGNLCLRDFLKISSIYSNYVPLVSLRILETKETIDRVELNLLLFSCGLIGLFLSISVCSESFLCLIPPEGSTSKYSRWSSILASSRLLLSSTFSFRRPPAIKVKTSCRLFNTCQVLYNFRITMVQSCRGSAKQVQYVFQIY